MLETISARELKRYSEDGRSIIIDLRSPQEYRRGHVPGALNVPRGRFRDELVGKKAYDIILYCDRGSLSLAVARELERAGYHPRSVVGGYRAYMKTMEAHND